MKKIIKYRWIDEKLFLSPNSIDMTETDAFLCAGYDGVSICMYPLMLPIDWLETEKPEYVISLQQIKALAIDTEGECESP